MHGMNDLLTLNSMTEELENAATIILPLLVASLLSACVAYIYMKTHKKEGYKQPLVQSIVFLCMIVAAAMLIIGNNLARAFSLVGAVSIIRFRTNVKDPKDMAFIFLSIVIGMACGLRLYSIGVSAMMLSGLIIWCAWKFDFGNSIKKVETQKLKIKMTDSDGSLELAKKGFDGIVDNWKITGMNTAGEGNITVEYAIILKKKRHYGITDAKT